MTALLPHRPGIHVVWKMGRVGVQAVLYMSNGTIETMDRNSTTLVGKVGR